MNGAIVYLQDAEDDIAAVHAGYEDERPGLGDRFLAALRDRLERIAESPEFYAVLHSDVRGAPLRRFPHIVYYRIQGESVLIIAVQHGRRGSRGWQRRI